MRADPWQKEGCRHSSDTSPSSRKSVMKPTGGPPCAHFRPKSRARLRDGGKGLDLAVGSYRREILKQLICYCRTTGFAIGIAAHKKIARLSMIWHVVGKRTDSLTKFIRVR